MSEPDAVRSIDLSKRFSEKRGTPMIDTATTPKPNATPQAVVPPSDNLESPRDPTLSEKVSAAQARISERTAPARAKAAEQSRAAADSAKEFVKEHPFVAMTGAVAIGALIALSLPGRPGRKVRGSVVTAGGVLAELAAKYGHEIMDIASNAAEESREKLGEIGESVSETSRDLANNLALRGESGYLSARHVGERAALSARQASEDAGLKSRSVMSRLRG
jgi:ElaB/YqjD/DUF883 family membrane-anchored ribosome-binding protein